MYGLKSKRPSINGPADRTSRISGTPEGVLGKAYNNSRRHLHSAFSPDAVDEAEIPED